MMRRIPTTSGMVGSRSGVLWECGKKEEMRRVISRTRGGFVCQKSAFGSQGYMIVSCMLKRISDAGGRGKRRLEVGRG